MALFPWDKCYKKRGESVVARPNANALGISPQPAYIDNPLVRPVDGRFLNSGASVALPYQPAIGRDRLVAVENPGISLAGITPDAGTVSGRTVKWEQWEKDWYSVNYNPRSVYELLQNGDGLPGEPIADNTQVYIDSNGVVQTLLGSRMTGI